VRASFGLKQEELSIVETILAPFLLTKKSYAVSVFGSRSQEKLKKYSDLDLWIQSDPPLNFQELAALRDQFEESELPFKVDLVTPENCLAEYQSRIQSELVSWLIKSG
jgi:type I restriction enzyme S subunit